MPTARFTSYRSLGLILAILLFGAAAFLLWRTLYLLSVAEVMAAISATPAWRLGASLAFTLTSFAALASYDVIAVRMVAPGRVPPAVAAAAGAAANAIANTLGFHAVTATAVRVRVFRRWGLGFGEVARIIALSWSALGLGFAATIALALLAASGGNCLSRAVGAVLACALAAMLTWMARESRIIGVGRFRMALPSGRVALLQAAIGTAETAATIAALYVLIPASLTPPFAIFAAAFITAVLLGIASHAPGGVGVFEATMLSIFPTGHASTLAALLLFRLIYNLLPFAAAVLGLTIAELTRGPHTANSSADIAE